MIWFRVYYANREPYEGPLELTPTTGVQAILQDDRYVGAVLWDSAAYYVWGGLGRSERWFPATQDAMWQYLSEPGPKYVLSGLHIDDDAFNEIKVQAIHDHKKIAAHRLERYGKARD